MDRARFNDRPPPHDEFFGRLCSVLNHNKLRIARRAYIFSKKAHEGQRRDGGSRYFDHPKAAAWIYMDELGGDDLRLIVDLLLHDVPEGSYLLDSELIGIIFGLKIMRDVEALTKCKGNCEPTNLYLVRVAARGPWAITAKLCDRLHNLRTLSVCPREKQLDQISETRRHHLPILIPALRSRRGIWRAYAARLETKIHHAIEVAEEELAGKLVA